MGLTREPYEMSAFNQVQTYVTLKLPTSKHKLQIIRYPQICRVHYVEIFNPL